MGNPKKDYKHFSPSHLGTQPRGFSGNNGKKMNDTSGKHAQVIQTSRIVAMSFCEPRSWTRVLSS